CRLGKYYCASVLPGLARPHGHGMVSCGGWCVGYLGGMLTLGLSLVVVSRGQAAGLDSAQYVPWVMLLTGTVFAVAAVPSLLWLRERHGPVSGVASAGQPGRPWQMLSVLARAWRETGRHYPDMRRLLICGACYHAGIAVV